MSGLTAWLCQLVANTGWLIGYWGACPVVEKLRYLALFGLVLVALRWLVQRRKTRQMMLMATPLSAADQAPVKAWAKRMGLVGPLRLLQHTGLPAPAFCLDRRTVIVNPVFMNQLDPAEQDGVWCHELAHLKRRDLQRYWAFHVLVAGSPLIAVELFASRLSCEPGAQLWLIARLMAAMVAGCWMLATLYKVAIEFDADQLAVSTTGDPSSLATALIRAQRWLKCTNSRGSVWFPALFGCLGFKWRIKRLLGKQPSRRFKPSLISLLTAALFLSALWLAQPAERTCDDPVSCAPEPTAATCATTCPIR